MYYINLFYEFLTVNSYMYEIYFEKNVNINIEFVMECFYAVWVNC